MKSLMFAAALLMAGATNAYADSAVVALTSADNGTSVNVANSTTVTLSLPQRGGVPYAWEISTLVDPQLTRTAETTEAVTPGMIGGPANRVFAMVATAPGTVTLAAGLYPFTGEKIAVQTVSITVTVVP